MTDPLERRDRDVEVGGRDPQRKVQVRLDGFEVNAPRSARGWAHRVQDVALRVPGRG